MKRDRAALLLEHVLRALDERQGDWPVSLVTGLYVFGSFARGAVEPHDVDLDVEFDGDERWVSHFVTCLSCGRDPHNPIRRMLTDGKRGCQFQLEALKTQAHAYVDSARREIEHATASLGKPFPQAAELTTAIGSRPPPASQEGATASRSRNPLHDSFHRR